MGAEKTSPPLPPPASDPPPEDVPRRKKRETIDLDGGSGDGHKIRIGTPAIVAILSLGFTAATFLSNFVFATKSELFREVGKMREEQIEETNNIKARMSAVQKSVDHSVEQTRIVNENLRAVARRFSVRSQPLPDPPVLSSSVSPEMDWR